MAQGGEGWRWERDLWHFGVGHHHLHHQLWPPPKTVQLEEEVAHPIDITPAVTPPWIPHPLFVNIAHNPTCDEQLASTFRLEPL